MSDLKHLSLPIADLTPGIKSKPEPVVIEIRESIETHLLSKGLNYSDAHFDIFFDNQAEELANALLKSLPQCMIEPLLIKLMQKRISGYLGMMK